MSQNNPSPTLEELIDDIIALGTDHPNGAFPDGKRSDGTYAPQNEEQAKLAIQQWAVATLLELPSMKLGLIPPRRKGVTRGYQTRIENDLRQTITEEARRLLGNE